MEALRKAQALLAKRDIAAAIPLLQEVLVGDTVPVEAYAAMANAQRLLKRHDDAERYARKGLAMDASHLGCLKQLSNALLFKGRRAEAIGPLRRILELQPNHDIELNLAIALLTTGNFLEGWRRYEARLSGTQAAWLTKYMQFSEPLWDGAIVKGKTLLFHAEQGFGDTFQFVRFLPAIEAAGASVVLRVNNRVQTLLAYSLPKIRVIGLDRCPTGFHAWAPLLSLGRLLGIDLPMLPGRHPYLFARPDLRTAWRQRLSLTGRTLRVGVCWAANTRYPEGLERSVPLEALAPIASVPDVELYSLQFGDEASAAGRLDKFDVTSFGDSLGPFEELAALMCELDLVISVDTATAHLAGGLGVPCWVLLPDVADWRWLTGRDDSPWYPGMKLFHRSQGDVSRQVDAVAEALLHVARSRRASPANW